MERNWGCIPGVGVNEARSFRLSGLRADFCWRLAKIPELNGRVAGFIEKARAGIGDYQPRKRLAWLLEVHFVVACVLIRHDENQRQHR